MKLECPECGGDKVKTEITTEIQPWGSEATYPLRSCDECHFSWIDGEGMVAITMVQRLWEAANTEDH